jgi:hypothetical protein
MIHYCVFYRFRGGSVGGASGWIYCRTCDSYEEARDHVRRAYANRRVCLADPNCTGVRYIIGVVEVVPDIVTMPSHPDVSFDPVLNPSPPFVG